MTTRTQELISQSLKLKEKFETLKDRFLANKSQCETINKQHQQTIARSNSLKKPPRDILPSTEKRRQEVNALFSLSNLPALPIVRAQVELRMALEGRSEELIDESTVPVFVLIVKGPRTEFIKSVYPSIKEAYEAAHRSLRGLQFEVALIHLAAKKPRVASTKLTKCKSLDRRTEMIASFIIGMGASVSPSVHCILVGCAARVTDDPINHVHPRRDRKRRKNARLDLRFDSRRVRAGIIRWLRSFWPEPMTPYTL